MGGPFADNQVSSEELGSASKLNETIDMHNQFKNYLFGFTPTVELKEIEAKQAAAVAQADKETKTPVKTGDRKKVNARDARLHFLMGKYNSG